VKDQLRQAIIDGDAGVATAMTQALIATGASAREILDEALLPGTDVVGTRMRETIALLKKEGLRDAVKVMVGGAPVTVAYAAEIGADGYGANAGMAVERAKELVG